MHRRISKNISVFRKFLRNDISLILGFHSSYISIDSVLGLVSEVHAASIFAVEGGGCFLCILKGMGKRGGYRVRIGASSGPVGAVDQENCTDAPFKSPKMSS
jgi:hypothetical protein